MIETMAAAITMTGQRTEEETVGGGTGGGEGCIDEEEIGMNQIKREVREAWVSKDSPIQGVPVKGNCEELQVPPRGESQSSEGRQR